MQVFSDPAAPSARDFTAREVRIEMAAHGDSEYGSVIHVNEWRDGALLITITRGTGEVRRQRGVDIIIVDPA